MAPSASIEMKGGLMFDLTDEERRVFLFFAYLALAGSLVGFFFKIYPCAEKAIRIDAADHIAKVNLNTAGFNELCEVPGVSPGLAKKIIACRASKGRFNSLEELKDVKGIGTKRYNKLKDLLYLQQ